MNLGKRIETWRTLRKLKQRHLAKACGISVSAVSLWESNETDPSQANLTKVVRRLGLTMEQFYGPIPESEQEAA